MILNAIISKNEVQELEIIPSEIIACQPNIAGNIDAKKMVDKIQRYSNGMGTKIINKNNKWIIDN